MKYLRLFEEFAQDDIYVITYENPVFLKFQDDDEVYDLLDYSNSAYEIMKELKDDFNSNELEQWMPEDLNIISIRATDHNVNNSNFTIKVRVKGNPTNEQITKIKEKISGQCSDGWGEGFEQTPVADRFYVSTWDREGPKIEFIESKKEV